MRSEPIAIDGLAGPVVVDVNNFTGKHSITVGGQAVKGTRRGVYELPGADGTPVSARLRAYFWNPYPSIEVAGVKHATGPGVPVPLRILSLLPIVLLGFGAIPIVIAGVGIIVNVAILRAPIPTVGKVISMIGVFVAALLAVVAIATAIQSATGR